MPGRQDDKPEVDLPYDPDAARAALADAGYGPDKPVPPVELWYNREGNNEAIFKAVGAMLDVVLSPKSEFQCTGWQSADHEKLLAQARIEPDEPQRAEHLSKNNFLLWPVSDRAKCRTYSWTLS